MMKAANTPGEPITQPLLRRIPSNRATEPRPGLVLDVKLAPLRSLFIETGPDNSAPPNSLAKAVPQMAVALIVTLLSVTPLPTAMQPQDINWSETKCELYQLAFLDAVERVNKAGLRPGFLKENDAFIASGCAAGIPVCAKTEDEIALANLLTVMTMNEGMASTFVPFACPPPS